MNSTFSNSGSTLKFTKSIGKRGLGYLDNSEKKDNQKRIKVLEKIKKYIRRPALDDEEIPKAIFTRSDDIIEENMKKNEGLQPKKIKSRFVS